MGSLGREASIIITDPPSLKDAVCLLEEIAQKDAHCGPRRVDKSLALYGAGNLGRMAHKFFSRVNIQIQFVVDIRAHALREDPFWEGIDLVCPDEVSIEIRKSVLLAVCVSTEPYSRLSMNLSEGGWNDIRSFYDIAEAYTDRHPLSNGWFSGPLEKEHLTLIDATLSRWADDISRAHHLQFIAWHRLREDWIFENAPVMEGNRYFIPEVLEALSDREVFLDIGAYHGDVSFSFLSLVDNQFNELWAIEADVENIHILRQNMDALVGPDKRKINVLSRAVGKEEGQKPFFNGLGGVSQISNLGQWSTDVTTIDTLNLAPTFVKLHIEGEELNALKGGRKTMLRNRPIIVATTYHNRSGLWELPNWLMDHLPRYHFFLRLHSWCDTGATIYCIPRERSNHDTVHRGND